MTKFSHLVKSCCFCFCQQVQLFGFIVISSCWFGALIEGISTQIFGCKWIMFDLWPMVFVVVCLVQPFRGGGLSFHLPLEARRGILRKYNYTDSALEWFSRTSRHHSLKSLNGFVDRFKGEIHGVALCEAFRPFGLKSIPWKF